MLFILKNRNAGDVHEKRARQREQYRDKAHFPEKSADEMLEWLRQKVNCEEESLDFLENSLIREMFLENIKSHAEYCEIEYSEETLQVVLLSVISDEKSAEYYADRSEGDDIYAIFELTTGYITTNCNKLNLELWIEKGINKDDWENPTPKFRDYLTKLISYENHEY